MQLLLQEEEPRTFLQNSPLGYWKLCTAQVLSTVHYFYCKCDWTQQKTKQNMHLLLLVRVTWLLLINWLLHIFLQSTVNLCQPKKTSRENIHKKGITSLMDISFLLYPVFSLARALARLGVKMGGRGGKRERLFFFWLCRQELLKAINLFQFPNLPTLVLHSVFLQLRQHASVWKHSPIPTCWGKVS